MARLVVLLAMVTACLVPALPVTASSRQLSYADLMQVPPAQRKDTFAALTPENRAAVMRQHLEQWLEVHGPDLSDHARTLVREVITTITPELYAGPPTGAASERQTELSHELACALGDDRASTLMMFDQPPPANHPFLADQHAPVDRLVGELRRPLKRAETAIAVGMPFALTSPPPPNNVGTRRATS